MNQTNLNNRAMEKFIALRHKLKLDVQKPILKKAITLTQEHIDKMTDVGQISNVNHARAQFDGGMQEAIEEARFVDNTFDYIESLNLPPKLSLAIGLIISAHKTENWIDLDNAIKNIKEYLLFKGFGGIDEEKRKT